MYLFGKMRLKHQKIKSLENCVHLMVLYASILVQCNLGLPRSPQFNFYSTSEAFRTTSAVALCIR